MIVLKTFVDGITLLYPCGELLLEYRHVQVLIIAKRLKQSPSDRCMESFYSKPRASTCLN